MLVLQRKKGQSLLLGDDIKVTVVEVTADGVRLAIEAPKDVKILREELSEATKANLEAAGGSDNIASLKSILNLK